MEWETPKNVDEVRSFMGLVGYYRRFVRNLLCIGYPITSLQRKGKNFEWTEECEASFEHLKQLLTHALVLKIENSYKEFVVCIDACKRGLDGFLMQEEKVVCYELRNLNEHDQNYPTHDLELTTIIHALKMWRHYLLGGRLTLMRDHSRLRYLFDQSNLKARQARWLATLSKFNFEMRYIKGQENGVVDALSRKV